MKIVRNDEDVLVLQSGGTGPKARHLLKIAAVLLPLAISVTAIWLVCASAWWPHIGLLTGAGIVAALVAGILLLSYVICDSMPLESCLALDRHAREILFVRQTLLRTSREEFNFDRVRDVVMDEIKTKSGVQHAVALQLTDGRNIRVAGPNLLCGSESYLYEIAAALRLALGIPEPTPRSKKADDRWPARIMSLVLGCFFVGAGVFLGCTANELWQARSWPQVEGVVESLELGKKMTSGKHPHLADAVEIVYRYQLGDTIYFGRRFKTSSNWLTPEEVPLVRQKYRPGSRCLVTYNPGNPARCFVQLHAEISNVIATGVASLLLSLVGLAVVAGILWQIARPKPPGSLLEADVQADAGEITVPA